MLRPLAVGIALACCACAGFRGDELARLDRRELESQERLPAISFHWERGPQELDGDSVVSPPEPETEALFRGAFVEAREALASNDLHVDLELGSTTINTLLMKGSFSAMLLSFGLVPAYGKTELWVRARVEYQGKFFHEYLYADQASIWAGLLLLPWIFWHDPFTARREIFDNMLLHFLRDLRRDLPQLLPGAGSARIPA